MICKNCGANIDDGSAFCEECGSKILSSAVNTTNDIPLKNNNFISNKIKWITGCLSGFLVLLNIIQSYCIDIMPFRNINLYLYIIYFIFCILINRVNPLFSSVPYLIFTLFSLLSCIPVGGLSFKYSVIYVIISLLYLLFDISYILSIRKRNKTHIKRLLVYQLIILICEELLNVENIIRWSHASEVRLVISDLTSTVTALIIVAIPVIVLLEIKKHSEYKEAN